MPSDCRQKPDFRNKVSGFFYIHIKFLINGDFLNNVDKNRMTDTPSESILSRLSSILTSFFIFMQAKVSPTFIRIFFFPINCVYLMP